MKMRIGTIGKAVAATVAAGAVLVGVLAVSGSVFAASRAPTLPGKDGTAARPGPDGRPRLLAGAYHGEGTWTFADGSTKSTTGDFGQVAKVSADSLTLKRLDGAMVTVPVTEGTCIRQGGQRAAITDLKPGERVLAFQQNGAALAIRAGRPLRGEPCGLLTGVVHGDTTLSFVDGSTKHLAFDIGRIKDIGDGSISLVRRDGQSVTLRYDDATVVVEEGHLGSIDDLKVGDGAMFFSQSGHADVIRCVRSPAQEGSRPAQS